MIKHSLTINGHRTSISLEEPFWQALREMAEQRQLPLSQLVSEIDQGRISNGRVEYGLSSAIRIYLLQAAREAAGPGHQQP